MTRWNQLQGNRGDETENLINFTNEYYKRKKFAIVVKHPVPIKVIEIKNHIITTAFFEEKAFVDYSGVVQGYPICFDSKETENSSLPLKNIKSHQIDYMKDYYDQKGLSFILAYFKIHSLYTIIPFEIVYTYYLDSFKGGRKSIPLDVISKDFVIPYDKSRGILDYIKVLNKYLNYQKTNKFNF